ncbi:MAG TPA: cytochrome d ubiquinol oxidase subunit II [Phycisphaerales bacterium]|nr:cytochrome d ubiquinol oxidase subunit II [Phycisphaerales bacterium]
MQVELLTAWAMIAALAAYTLLGGADFGAGVWDLLASGPRRAAQRELLAAAIGPIWEANHVWLILLIVLLFTCFPPAFAAVMTALHVPVLLLLLGIVARGASFVFRTYTSGTGAGQARWGLVFSIASVVTPLLLGVVLGAASSGQLRWHGDAYLGGFFAPWLRPFPWAVGVFTLAIFAFLAATYLCAEAEDPALREDFRRRALAAGAAVALAGGLAWWAADADATVLGAHLNAAWWGWPLRIATGLAAAGALAALWKRRFLAARTCACAQVMLVVLGYGAALFPHLVPPDFTVFNSAAPPITHFLVLGALAGGAVVLGPSLYFLLRVFKGQRAFALLDSAATRTPQSRGTKPTHAQSSS